MHNLLQVGRVINPKICRPGPTGLWAGYAPAKYFIISIPVQTSWNWNCLKCSIAQN